MTETQYYITKPGGHPAGPFSIDQLEAMAADGRLTPEHLYCVEGMVEWLPASRIVDFPGSEQAQTASSPVPAYMPRSTPPPTSRQPAGDKPDTHKSGAITLTILSFLLFPLSIIFALVALVQASRADTSWSAGDESACLRYAKSAGLWCRITGIIIVLQIFMVVAGAIYVCTFLIPYLEENYRIIIH